MLHRQSGRILFAVVTFATAPDSIVPMSTELLKIFEELKISDELLVKNKLGRCEQLPLNQLEIVDIDFEGKPFILEANAASSWRKMRTRAASEGIVLDPFSGFRSYKYQMQLIKRKLEKGKPLEMILTETAIPGYSEHHTGKAIDICTDGRYCLEESFENTRAFAWLTENARDFSFRMSYPRQNKIGIIYEPWHWLFIG